jgi:hypothetical protein
MLKPGLLPNVPRHASSLLRDEGGRRSARLPATGVRGKDALWACPSERPDRLVIDLTVRGR